MSALTQSDLSFLFARGDVSIAETEADNAWDEGKNIDANPYPEKSIRHYHWNHRWLERNGYFEQMRYNDKMKRAAK